MRKDGHTAAQLILIAALRLREKGRAEFTEWDLTVESWCLDRKRFGCRGYEDIYPDHKRVMMEIMGTKKRDNPVARGWLRRTRANSYCMTADGIAQAIQLSEQEQKSVEYSRAEYYDLVSKYLNHKLFRAFQISRAIPNMWLSVEAFYGITTTEKSDVETRLRALEDAVKLARSQISQKGELTRGPVGGGRVFTLKDLEDLMSFHAEIQKSFNRQLESIRSRGGK